MSAPAAGIAPSPLTRVGTGIVRSASPTRATAGWTRAAGNCIAEGLAGRVAASFGGPYRCTHARGAEFDLGSMAGKLAAVIDRAGIVADPCPLNSKPPIAAEQVILSHEFVLRAAKGAIV